jgi:hypothetical protein
MNSFLARGSVVFKQDMAAFEQSPRARAVHEQLRLTPRPEQQAAAMFLGEPQPSGPKGLWLSCQSGKSWTLRYLKELHKGDRAVFELHMGDLRNLEYISTSAENTLVLIDGFDSASMRVEGWGLLKQVCEKARVVVAAQERCPDIAAMQARFLNIGGEEVVQINSLLA